MSRSLFQTLIVLLVCIFSIDAKGQLTANFTASDTSGCNPMIVHFTNTSTGGATSYSWDFGNGNFATSKDASASYLAVGAFTVTLTVYDGSGGISSKSMVVRAYTVPTVNFTASSVDVCPRAPVTFTSTSTSGAWGSLDYVWNFGDGSSSTLASPSYSYVPPGYYNITLYATNKAGCVASLTKGTYIHVYSSPRSRFGAASTYFCTYPSTAVFNNTSSGTAPMTYTWNFGDATTSVSVSPSHSYTTFGAYNVKLVTTDANGCKDSLTQPAMITVGNLKAGYSSVSRACANTNVFFTDTSTPHTSVLWDFGDGSFDDKDVTKHIYAAAGTYIVKERIYDGFCYDSVIKLIDIFGPVGSFSSVQACTPLSTETFTASAPPFTTLAWDLGDGFTSTATTVTHTYMRFGKPENPAKIYDVSLTIKDTVGCTNTITQPDTLFNLWANVTSPDPSLKGCSPLLLHFEAYPKATIVNPFSVNPPDDLFITVDYPFNIASYTWDFGDGSATVTTPTPAHIFTAAGVYTTKCHIVTTNGCSADSSIIVKVGTPQSATFTMDKTRACAGQPIVYTRHTTSKLIDRYDWGFDDGNSQSGPYDTVVINKSDLPGIHQPHLTVIYHGCPSFAPYMMRDTIDSPTAIIAVKHVCIPNNSIAFGDSSIGDDARLWQFGDGFTSTAKNPVHNYSALTDYYVRLTTLNTRSGCRDTAYQEINLERLYKALLPQQGQVCRDMEDTVIADIRNVMNKKSGGAYSMARECVWYLNGTATDTTTPEFTYPGANPPNMLLMTDTVKYPFKIRGANTVTLVVTDNHGCKDTASVTITAAKPIAAFTSAFADGCAPVPATHTDISTDVPGVAITDYYWSFGDGATASVTTPVITHSYTTAGTYIITEVVVDAVGCSDTLKGSVKPKVFKPTADFTVSDQAACLKTSISFTNMSTASTAWLWLFGDGDTSTLSRPVHTYTTSGLYTVKLVASDAFGCTDTMTKVDYITINPLPTASFAMDDSFAVCPPLKINFSNTSIGATGFQWAFGDGTFSLNPNPNAIYSSPGAYRIKLTASNMFGCIDTAVRNASTFGYAGAFSYTPKSVCTGSPVNFKTMISGVSSVVWDFADGNISSPSTIDTITHVYAATGKFLPKLFLVDKKGCSNFSTGADTIKVDTLIPHFTFTPTTGCSNAPITFRDSSYSKFTSSSAWLWSFGSGATSTVSSPSYTYTVAGTHTATLTVTGSAGCSSTISRNIFVNSAPAVIAGSPNVCTGQTTILTDATSGGVWASSNTVVAPVSSGVVSGITNGTATISYTLSNGCRETVTVSVYPLPAAITGTLNVCIGLTAKLSNATAGGTWASSNSAIATVGTSGLVTGAGAGTTTITYATGTGCIATKVVTVEAAPGAITGSTSICRGLTSALSNSTPGGTWASNNIAIASIGTTTGIVTGAAVGTATITYKVASGCTTTIQVSVNPVPGPITGSVTQVCMGVSATLSNGTPGGTWSSSNTAVATIGTPTAGVYTGSGAGTATISYTTGAGCSASKTVTVNAGPLPITGAAQVCTGLTTTMSSNAGGTWTSTNSTVATVGGSSGVVNAIAPGTATISYTFSTGCATGKTITVYPLPTAITGINKVCEGLTATLSDAVAGGNWSSGNTAVASIGSASGTYTGLTAGTAGITYTIGTGCQITTIVTVNPQPVATTGTTNLCIGRTTTLSNATTGGVWSTGSSLASVGSSSGIVTGIAAGTAVVSYSLGACVAEETVTVNPLPTAITGSMSVCEGQTALLSDAVVGGSWTSGNTSIATIGAATGVYAGVVAGTTDITYTVGTGCQTTTTITVNTQPLAITGTAGICIGSTGTLINVTGGGTWSTMATSISVGSSTGIVTGIATGTAIVSYNLGTCVAEKTITVNPLPVAITGSNTVCAGVTITLNNSDPGGTWSSSNTAIVSAGSASGDVTGITAGTATVTYRLGTGCITTHSVTVYAPAAPITGPSSVCVDATVSLSSLTTPGSWMSTNTAVATIGSTGTVTGISSGTTAITYTLSTGCFTTDTITVNPLPADISGIAEVCQGLTTTLGNTDMGGTWTSISTAVATIDPALGIVTGITAGTSSITYTLPTGCIADTIVTVLPLPDAIGVPSTACVGPSITLTNTSVPAGTWSTVNTTIATIDAITGVVTGVAPGTATITYTLLTGCQITETIVVNPLPLPVTAATKKVCAGLSITLSSASAGGTWSSGATTITIDGTTGVVTGITAGTAAVTYTLATGCAITDSVIVNPLPAAITGATQVCLGLTTTLSNTTTPGTWSSIDATISIDALSGLVTGLVTGTATVTYQLPTTCLITTTVTVNELPSAFPATTPICIGATTALSNLVTGGTWGSGNISVATINATTGVVTGVSAGTASMTYTTGAGCKAATTVTVNPNIPDITGIPTVCHGLTTTLFNTVKGGTWTSSDTSVVKISTAGVATGVKPGGTEVTYIADNNCGIASIHVHVNPQPEVGAITGPGKVCSGTSITLANSVDGGVWTSTNTTIATIDAGGILSGVAAGTTNITYAYTNSCGTAKTGVAIIVNQTPEQVRITTHPASTPCNNTLYQNFGTDVPEPKNMQYTWTVYNGYVYATAPDRQYCLVNFNEPGTATVILKVGNAGTGCMNTDTLHFEVGGTTAAQPQVIYYAPEFICKDNTSESFQWGYDSRLTLDSTLLVGMVNQNYENRQPDFANKHYWVITKHNGCLQKSYYNAPLTGSSITQNGLEFLLYPNPAGDIINIQVRGINRQYLTEAKVYDVMGRERNTVQLVNGSAAIQLDGYIPGVYMVMFTSNGEKIGSRTFIKE